MIKIEQLIPGETVLMNDYGCKVKVLDKLTNIVFLSDDDNFEQCSVGYTMHEINEGYSIHIESKEEPIDVPIGLYDRLPAVVKYGFHINRTQIERDKEVFIYAITEEISSFYFGGRVLASVDVGKRFQALPSLIEKHKIKY